MTISAAKLYGLGRSEDDVAYRHIRFEATADWAIGEFVSLPWEEQGRGKKQVTHFTLPVGAVWYQREKGKPHGSPTGASRWPRWSFLVSSCSRSSRRRRVSNSSACPRSSPSGKMRRKPWPSRLPTRATWRPRTPCPFGRISKVILDRNGEIAPGKREAFSCKVLGAYETDLNREPIRDKTLTALTVQLGHAGLDGKMVWQNYGRETVRVTVKPKPTKIDTDALKAFDEL